MAKKVKKIYGICDECARQLYPSEVLKSDRLKGITISMAPCDICGIKRANTPVRDYFYAITGNELFWD